MSVKQWTFVSSTRNKGNQNLLFSGGEGGGGAFINKRFFALYTGPHYCVIVLYPHAYLTSCRFWKQSNLFNTDTRGTEPIVRFTEVSLL